MEQLFTNEIFIISLSLIFLMFALQEGPMKPFARVDNIAKMQLHPSTSMYIKQFKPGLQGVEVGWSAIVLGYAVLNVILLLAVLTGHGPFLFVLRPSLVYPELITNTAILLGNRLACGALSRSKMNVLACFVFSLTKIFGIAMGIYRWLATFLIWWFAPAVSKIMERSSSVTTALSRRLCPDRRNMSPVHSSSLLRPSGSVASLGRLFRRRLTKSMSSKSQIMSQISTTKSPIGSTTSSRMCDLELLRRRTRSMNSILESIILEDWENEDCDEPPVIRAERRLAPGLYTSSSEPTVSLRDTNAGNGTYGEEEEDHRAEREDILQVCRLISVVMAPESVVMGWQQCSAMDATAMGPALYDDWRFLLLETKALHASRDINSVQDEYILLDRLCGKVLESRYGPRISLSTGSMEEDDMAFEGVEEDLIRLTPGERAAKILGVNEMEVKSGSRLTSTPEDRNLISVESYLFARFANLARGCQVSSSADMFLNLDDHPSVWRSGSNDKSIQVNTLSESAIRKMVVEERGRRNEGEPRIVRSRDAFVQVDTLPRRYLNRKVA